jgi:NitT/TauT family transport system permease protein
VLLWQLATMGNTRTDIPGPGLVLDGLIQLLEQGVLVKNVVASLFRVAWGFALAASFGIPLGIIMGRTAAANRAVDPVVQILRPISPIAWLPISTLLFGGVTFFDPADVSSIFLIFLAAFFPIVTATRAAVRAIDPRYLRSAQNFGVDGADLIRWVVLPAALPQILTGLRLALGMAWVVVVAAEMLGVQSGLGFQVNDARNNLRYDLVIAAMVMIGLIGLALDRLMTAIDTAVLRRRGLVRR